MAILEIEVRDVKVDDKGICKAWISVRDDRPEVTTSQLLLGKRDVSSLEGRKWGKAEIDAWLEKNPAHGAPESLGLHKFLMDQMGWSDVTPTR